MSEVSVNPLTARFKALCSAGDWQAAKTLLEAEEMSTSAPAASATESLALKAQTDLLRGWFALQFNVHRLVGVGQPHFAPASNDILLISNSAESWASWSECSSALTHVMIDHHRGEQGPADADADLLDDPGLPLDGYVDAAIEIITERALRLGAPLLVVDGSPWLALAAATVSSRLALPMWWDLRDRSRLQDLITEGHPHRSPYPQPDAEIAFMAAKSAARLVVKAANDVQRLSRSAELAPRLLVVGEGTYGATPRFSTLWEATDAYARGLVPSVEAAALVGPLRATYSISRRLRISTIGSVPTAAHNKFEIRVNPPEVLPEDSDVLIVDAMTPSAWQGARHRVQQARQFGIPVIAVGHPAEADRALADVIATDAVPPALRAQASQPAWGHVTFGERPFRMDVMLRAAGLPAEVTPFNARPTDPQELVPRPGFRASSDRISVMISSGGEDGNPPVGVSKFRGQRLHPSLFTAHSDTPKPQGAVPAPVISLDISEPSQSDTLLGYWADAPWLNSSFIQRALRPQPDLPSVRSASRALETPVNPRRARKRVDLARVSYRALLLTGLIASGAMAFLPLAGLWSAAIFAFGVASASWFLMSHLQHRIRLATRRKLAQQQAEATASSTGIAAALSTMEESTVADFAELRTLVEAHHAGLTDRMSAADLETLKLKEAIRRDPCGCSAPVPRAHRLSQLRSV